MLATARLGHAKAREGARRSGGSAPTSGNRTQCTHHVKPEAQGAPPPLPLGAATSQSWMEVPAPQAKARRLPGAAGTDAIASGAPLPPLPPPNGTSAMRAALPDQSVVPVRL